MNVELKVLLRRKYDSKNNLIDAIRSANCKPQLTIVCVFFVLLLPFAVSEEVGGNEEKSRFLMQ